MLLGFASLSLSAHSAERLITTGGTVTEIVFALNGGKDVVATDTSSTYPRDVFALPKVGYYRDLAAEGVLSLAPTSILALEGAGRPEALKLLKQTGIRLKVYKKPESVAALFVLINNIAKDIGKPAEAKRLIAKIEASLPKPQKLGKGKGLFILSAGDRGLVAAGTKTVANLLFEYTGVKNIAESHEGFKAMNIEFLAVNQPDFIVAPSHVVKSAGGKQDFCNQPSLKLLTAAQECKLLVMDGLLSLGMTPRLAQAISAMNDYKVKTL